MSYEFERVFLSLIANNAAIAFFSWTRMTRMQAARVFADFLIETKKKIRVYQRLKIRLIHVLILFLS